MLESKASNQMEDAIVLAKKEVAIIMMQECFRLCDYEWRQAVALCADPA